MKTLCTNITINGMIKDCNRFFLNELEVFEEEIITYKWYIFSTTSIKYHVYNFNNLRCSGDKNKVLRYLLNRSILTNRSCFRKDRIKNYS